MTEQSDMQRIAAAGEGLGPYNKLMAQLCASLDECVSELAQGDRVRALEALVSIGMTKTAELLGATTSVGGDTMWRTAPFPFSRPRVDAGERP